MEHQDTKIKFSFNCKPSFDFITLTLCFETDVCGDVVKEFLSFKEARVRQTLIALGWTPPAHEIKNSA